MCGFVVTTDIDNCSKMMERQQFRGPDAMGMWKDKHIAMAHALLDINGKKQLQPYKTKKNNYLVFNGEMYDTNIQNDTKYLADGLETYGFKFLEWNDWHGSLAWYQPEKKKLVICRDHFGAKPLWVYKKGKNVTVTTSLRSLTDLKENKQVKQGFIVNSLLQGHESPYKDVLKVAPGEYVIFDFDKNTIIFKNLWNSFKIKSNPFNEADFRTRLISNIQKIAYNRQKTGLFLSGGFDSTFALSVVKDMDIDLTVYICAYDKTKGLYFDHDGFREESRLAAQTCKEWGVKHKILVLQQDQIYDYDRRWLNNARFPWSDRNRRVPRYFLCREAAKDGCKVILTGDSADELFSGYLHHHKYWLEGYCEEKLKYYKKAKWFPNIEFSDDKWNNMLISDLLITSEQNILATDQTCGMFGMESRPVYLGQNFVRYCYEFDGMTKFTQRFGWDTGTYKYLLREVMGDMLPTHVKERKKKTGWSSPWDNNPPRVQNEWRIADWQYMTELT